MTTYEVLDVDEIEEKGAPLPPYTTLEELRDWGAYDSHIYRLEDGVPVEHIGSDGGEPEDQTIRRDWAWVVPALQAAYERGRAES